MSEECIFCHHDPYHYVDIGVGFQAAAVNCCELGVALYQYGDEDLAKVADRIEELEAKLVKALKALKEIKRYSPCGDSRRKAIDTLAELTGEQP